MNASTRTSKPRTVTNALQRRSQLLGPPVKPGASKVQIATLGFFMENLMSTYVSDFLRLVYFENYDSSHFIMDYGVSDCLRFWKHFCNRKII